MFCHQNHQLRAVSEKFLPGAPKEKHLLMFFLFTPE
jgi:hypothetical protein